MTDVIAIRKVAGLGSKVTYYDISSALIFTRTLVLPAQANMVLGLISIESEIGRVLTGMKEGEVYEGEYLRLRITHIE